MHGGYCIDSILFCNICVHVPQSLWNPMVWCAVIVVVVVVVVVVEVEVE